jgi:hypothetical protein
MTSRRTVRTVLIQVVVGACQILTDAGQLGEELDQCAQEQPLSPLRDLVDFSTFLINSAAASIAYLEHDGPAGGSDRFLRRQCSPDLVVFRLDPFVVGAVVMQLPQNFHPLVVTVFLDQIPWTLRQPD